MSYVNNSPRVNLYFKAGKSVIDLASMAQPLRVKSEILKMTCTKHVTHLMPQVSILLMPQRPMAYVHQRRR